MFEEAPNNLPVVDILENVETAPGQAGTGVLSGVQARPRPQALQPVSAMPPASAFMETPSGGARRVLLFVGISVVALILFVGGGWVLLRVVTKKQAANVPVVVNTNTAPEPTTPAVNAANIPIPIVPAVLTNTSNTNSENTNVPVTQPPANIPPPTPVTPTLKDTDADGLNDTQEISIGTNPSVADSDNDGLTDFEEVRQWKSDPLNPDTDGDGYTDGGEVAKGYSPTGSGKIQRAP
ncbi:hypothetical protein KBD18_00190 [Patescibacteria group bacterium]|nr:hypothetical protein [Patescibacteria group bacterium]